MICLFAMSCNQAPHFASHDDVSMGKHAEESEMLNLEMDIEVPRTASPVSPPDYSLKKGSKVIKKGFMKFEVDKLNLVKAKVDSCLSTVAGYYESEQFHSYTNRNSYSLIIRVPNKEFIALVVMFENGIGQLTEKSIKANDVTEEFVDLNIRLDNNLAYLKQYKEILSKAKSIKEILEVQEIIRRIEEEIESKKGRIKYLNDKVNYSTLNLELSELIAREFADKPIYHRRIFNAFNNGVQGLLSFVVGVVNIWPFIILVGVLFVGRNPIVNIFRRAK